MDITNPSTTWIITTLCDTNICTGSWLCITIIIYNKLNNTKCTECAVILRIGQWTSPQQSPWHRYGSLDYRNNLHQQPGSHPWRAAACKVANASTSSKCCSKHIHVYYHQLHIVYKFKSYWEYFCKLRKWTKYCQTPAKMGQLRIIISLIDAALNAHKACTVFLC